MERRRRQPAAPGKGALQDYARASGYVQLALQFGVSIVLGCLGGWGLDRWLGTFPALALSGTLAGAVAGFYQLYRGLVPPGPPPQGLPRCPPHAVSGCLPQDSSGCPPQSPPGRPSPGPD